MKLRVLTPGPLTTIQDQGRFGYIASGIGTCGVMDADAYDAANYLVGNRHGEAVLEATLAGPSILFETDCICAVTGADMDTRIGGVPVEPYRPFWVQAGQVLAMGFARTGCRGYLAVQGGFDVPAVMGSRSTDLKCAIGGLEGRALRAGDVLTVPDESRTSVMDRKRHAPVYSQSVTVRVVPGPQADAFAEEGWNTFWHGVFRLSTQSDRMGLRMEGPAIATKHGADIVSDGIALGAIQVTSAGQPIILMADRQTTGGYAKIGTVCTVDLPKLAQLKPGAEVRFEMITVEQAQRRLKQRKWRAWFC